MANEAALKFLIDKITALRVISQEMTRIYLTINDLNVADRFRADITSINQLLFALESAHNSLVAASNPIPPPSEARIAALADALRELDGFVRSDQDIHRAFDFLNQIADLVKNA